MFRNIFLTVALMGVIGCAGTTSISKMITPNKDFVKVKQFIDVDETLLLAPKMKKNTVLQYIGTPVEVRAGICLRDSSIIEIWIYNVKEKIFNMPVENITEKPPKNFKATDWDSPKKYALFFLNDGLVKWGCLEDVWKQFDKYGDIIAPISINDSSSTNSNTVPKRGLLGILK